MLLKSVDVASHSPDKNIFLEDSFSPNLCFVDPSIAITFFISISKNKLPDSALTCKGLISFFAKVKHGIPIAMQLL